MFRYTTSRISFQRYFSTVQKPLEQFSTVGGTTIEVSMGKYNDLRIAFNRPETHNAFNTDMMNGITDIFKQVQNDEIKGVRSIVLTGNGKSFSSGADLNYMKSMVELNLQQNKEDSEFLFDMFHHIKACPVPVIAMVNGPAIAGGTGIVAACDFALSVSRAKFGLTEARLGLIPAVISKHVMDKIGKGNCRRYMLTAELFSAEQAHKMGLISEVFSTPEELSDNIDKIVETINSNAPNAVKNTKTLIEEVSCMPTVLSTKEYVSQRIAEARISEEAQVRIRKFLEKK